jgi:lipoprotein-releasing system permease protein
LTARYFKRCAFTLPAMPYELFLAFRYFSLRRRRARSRATALAAIVGTACGVAALIIALALANGFRDEMRDKILRGTAHITLLRRDGQAMTEWRVVAARARRVEGVTDAFGTTYDGVLLSSATNSAYAVLRGADFNSLRAVQELRRVLVAGAVEPLINDARQTEASNISPSSARADEELPNALIGAELAARANLQIGDVAEIIYADPQLSLARNAPLTGRVRVCGIFRYGLYEYDATWIYLSLANASKLAGAPVASASAISLETTDIYDAARIATRVREAVGRDYAVVDWQEANRPLFAALALERQMILVVIALIIFISALNVTTTLVLVVVERRADIAILRAMGARSASIMLIFIFEGACIGIIGALFGAALGLAACGIGERYHLVSLPPDVYSLSNIPFHARARDVAISLLVAFILSLLATIYPARKASQLRPAEALRDA